MAVLNIFSVAVILPFPAIGLSHRVQS